MELPAFYCPVDCPRVDPDHRRHLFGGNHADLIGTGPTPAHGGGGFRLGNDELLDRFHGDLSSPLDLPDPQCTPDRSATDDLSQFSVENRTKSLARTEFF